MIVESLEQRLLLAGNVKVRADEGILFIQGDRAGNDIEITPGDSNGEIRLAGNRLDGSPTTINGNSSLTVRSDSIRILLGMGDDVVEVRDVQFRDDLLIRNKAGHDQVRFINSSIRTASVVRLGHGEDHLCFQSSTAEDLKIRLGGSADRLDLNDTQIRGLSILNGRGGIDTLAQDQASNIHQAVVKNFELFDEARTCGAKETKFNNCRICPFGHAV